ncbi:ABC transporter ATP-binding protein [Nocardiopsis changdeensis]|uniref:ATP-binding cassette domain-containing protein n=1 Tax=Nocardiopsis changdeensis TaxID=2831969 RepID=A0ABX8BKT7_9ACTN|nr:MULTISPECIES: ATP-binding cassette domain-containing protein [Nocardiopsis]QUX22345.1 ATP-binding cassette domain-containing protein [Nocardiopsis changdeensis]QYX38286.1 ATP-binding cassette domain-containing protein [Nocardiopsis sp. MT53]
MIAVRELVKRYGGTVAVDGLTFTVEPGRVTGFLGPNGAGKSTTLRMVLGLDAPTSGSATVGGMPYRDLPSPTRRVGALLDPGAVEPGRTARGHLLWQARGAGIGRARVDEVLGLVGLADRGGHRIRHLSLGMRQRLGIAGALLGDPGVLILDEPLNGLDPEGIVWVRRLLRGFADEGRTVLVSSHLMNEMEATADHVLVISRGRLVADVGIAELAAGARERVEVATPDPGGLSALLARAGAAPAPAGDGRLEVTGMDAARVGELAAAHGIVLHALVPVRARLEDAFIRLTGQNGRAADGAAGEGEAEGEWVR